jgi:hypothetical protein
VSGQDGPRVDIGSGLDRIVMFALHRDDGGRLQGYGADLCEGGRARGPTDVAV